ncbi:uncharacterized protein MYCGRDRAFT_103894 [Zymoseptoria tritici IPO323]|uniref:Uncharacterized protein n=1 Tax=Zymoseptoria tritici (strain CBS 115943 / IPO323) TaxID=336722 RepID=F9X5T6_ZYMTI|nr:uncharacterized protein MYCGRDRAFT_103894 [Zymoseptoria tritici IPO323]EGP89230.1 hypothetical protein MYCGRDRAFT_103894 [Zymoseptoria tritici IPO323]
MISVLKCSVLLSRIRNLATTPLRECLKTGHTKLSKTRLCDVPQGAPPMRVHKTGSDASHSAVSICMSNFRDTEALYSVMSTYQNSWTSRPTQIAHRFLLIRETALQISTSSRSTNLSLLTCTFATPRTAVTTCCTFSSTARGLCWMTVVGVLTREHSTHRKLLMGMAWCIG